MKNKTLYKLTIATLAISSIVNPMVSFTESQAARQTISASQLDTSQIKSQIAKLTNEINQAKSDLRRIDKEAIDYYLALQNFDNSGDDIQTKEKLEAEYNSTFNQLKEVDAKYKQIKSQLDNQSSNGSLSSSEQQRLNELAKIYENEELDGMRFYKSLNDAKIDKVMSYFEKYDSQVNSGTVMDMALKDGQKSALALDNQILSAKLLIKANEKRAQYGLIPINTSAYTQFVTQVKIEGDKRIRNHYDLPATPHLSENLLIGGEAFKDEPWEDLMNDYFKLGYDEEKGYFDAIVNDLYPNVTLNSIKERHDFYESHLDELENEATRRNQIIGHYTNLLSSNFDKGTQGMSIANGFVNNTFIHKTYLKLNNYPDPITPQQLLNQLESFKQTDARNKAEYKQLLAKKSGQSSDEANLQRQLNELSTQKQALTNRLNTLRSKIEQIDKTDNNSTDVKSKYEAKMKEYKAKITQINAKIDQVNALKAKVKDPNKLLKIAYPEIPETSEEKEKEMAIKADEEEKAKQLELEKNSPQKPLTPEELAQQKAEQKAQQKDKQNSEEEIMDLGEIDHSKDKKTTQPKLQADDKDKTKSSEKASTNIQKAKIDKTSKAAQSNEKHNAQQVNKPVERKADLPKSGGVPETGDLTNNAGLVGIIGSSLVGMFAAWKNRKKDQ